MTLRTRQVLTGYAPLRSSPPVRTQAHHPNRSFHPVRSSSDGIPLPCLSPRAWKRKPYVQNWVRSLWIRVRVSNLSSRKMTERPLKPVLHQDQVRSRHLASAVPDTLDIGSATLRVDGLRRNAPTSSVSDRTRPVAISPPAVDETAPGRRFATAHDPICGILPNPLIGVIASAFPERAAISEVRRLLRRRAPRNDADSGPLGIMVRLNSPFGNESGHGAYPKP